jgi:hypothetical protein
MINLHKLEDGDVIKILPMIDKNDKIYWIKNYDCAFVDWRLLKTPSRTSIPALMKVIYDDTDKSYLKRISHKLRESKKLQITTRYGMNIYIDGEIRILNVTKTLFEIIKNNKELLDIRGNHQLFVVKDEIRASGQVFPDWKKSYVSEKSWKPPVNDINSKDEWCSYIKSNQPDFDNHVEKNNIFNQKQLLVNLLGTDMLAELISDDRQKKLDKILV